MTIAALLFALVVTSNAEESRTPVLLDFHASWCGPCKEMRPAIQQLIRAKYPVKSVDIDEQPELAGRYKVQNVPTFIVVDRSGRQLARTEGFQAATDLAGLYTQAAAKVRADAGEGSRPRPDDDEDPRDDGGPGPHDAEDPGPRPARPAANPDPWESVVRIKIQGNGSIGFGSGTVIYSDADQSIILTCAHIFKVEGQPPARPSQFNRPILIDLFDGTLHSKQPAQVHYTETVPGKAIDYDFDRDVGLIVIHPGRKLPASRVVPPSWTPQSKMKMTTVGCSHGADATAWTSYIVRPLMRGLSNSPSYEAIECTSAPKQGRSGGGLYTEDGFLAGVCDFAEPHGNHGLYATPRSIHAILDRNRLTALYQPRDRQGDTLLAGGRPRPTRTRSATAPSIARAQSPDADESNRVTIPPPELLGIKAPAPAVAQNSTRKASSRNAWHSAQRTDQTLPPEVDNDRFHAMPAEQDDPEPLAKAPATRPVGRKSRTGWRPVREPSVPLSASNAP